MEITRTNDVNHTVFTIVSGLNTELRSRDEHRSVLKDQGVFVLAYWMANQACCKLFLLFILNYIHGSGLAYISKLDRRLP